MIKSALQESIKKKINKTQDEKCTVDHPQAPEQHRISYNWIDANGFQVKIENEIFSVECSRFCQNAQLGYFT